MRVILPTNQLSGLAGAVQSPDSPERCTLLFGFLSAALNILILEDWYNHQWLDVIELSKEPPKFQRNPAKAGAAHRLPNIPQRE